jgi:hypothetical protein
MAELQQDSFQAVFVLLWPVIQQWMTGSKLAVFKWIGPDSSDRLKMTVSAIAAACSTAGFHWGWTGDAVSGWHVALAIPPLAAICHMLGAWIAQHHLYSIAIKNPALTKILVTQTQRLIEIQAEHLEVVKGK